VDLTNRHQVLRGPSLYAYRPIVVCSFLALGFGIITLIALFATVGPHPTQSTWSTVTSVIGVVIGLAVLTLIGSLLAGARSRAELARGYTTTPFGYPEVDLVDPRTGIVLRSAGESLIDKKTFLVRRSEARLTMKSSGQSSQQDR
jgi:hypothetical protein